MMGDNNLILSSGRCELCQISCSIKCSGCFEVFYCSKEHQKSDWKNHKKNCRPYKICCDEILGRHLIATRDIPANKIILKEHPLVWGPSQETTPVCLGCCKEISENTSKPCSKCGWPVCKNDVCEKTEQHKAECEYTRRTGKKIVIKKLCDSHSLFQTISVLRCLFLKENASEKWKKLQLLESHDKERENTEKYDIEQKHLVPHILEYFNLSGLFSKEEVIRIFGILLVNAHEVPLTNNPYIAIFDVASLLEHSCHASCTKSFTNNGEILITSGKKLKKGDHLSICYADPLWGTENRRSFLNETKFFWCNCQRCADTSDFGTYYNALKCVKSNCKGYFLPKSFLQTENCEKQKWNCSKCDSNLVNDQIQNILTTIQNDLSCMVSENQSLHSSYERFCKKIKSIENTLHENHYFLTEVKFDLCQRIGQEYGLKNVSNQDLEYKTELCYNLNCLTEKLIPAEKRVRGLILFELHAALAEMGRRKSVCEKNPQLFWSALVESKYVLEQALEMLKFEPEILPEGKIYMQGVTNLRDITSILNKVSV